MTNIVLERAPQALATTIRAAGARPTVRGKSLYLGEEKLTVRGVTYGPFGSDADGGFDPATTAADFTAIVWPMSRLAIASATR